MTSCNRTLDAWWIIQAHSHVGGSCSCHDISVARYFKTCPSIIFLLWAETLSPIDLVLASVNASNQLRLILVTIACASEFSSIWLVVLTLIPLSDFTGITRTNLWTEILDLENTFLYITRYHIAYAFKNKTFYFCLCTNFKLISWKWINIGMCYFQKQYKPMKNAMMFRMPAAYNSIIAKVNQADPG